jgi:hypothetical protein
MEEGTPQDMIFKRSRELEKALNIKYKDLERNSPSSNFQKECILNLKSNFIMFLLQSMSNRKIFDRIQITTGALVEQPDSSLSKSSIQAIRHSDLVRLIAYFELVLEAKINEVDLEEFSLPVHNSKGNILFVVRMLPRWNVSCKEKEDLRIHFRFNSEAHEDKVDAQFLNIEDDVSVDEIKIFNRSLKAFLSQLTESNPSNAADL